MVCPSWLSFMLYNPARKALTNREKVLKESGITGESVVLEVGAGNGFFTEMLARTAKKVYAVELQAGMLEKLKKRIAGCAGKVEVLHGNVSDIDLPDAFADVAFIYYAFHEIERKPEGVRKIARAVKVNGILSIYEPAIEVGREAMDKTRDAFESAGFRTEVRRDTLFTRFLRMRKEGGKSSR
ncbi:MAG: class I SAM-dependent methyltransferase [Nitrospirota bacterium]|nr:class I SAM-dependent methyltransferase [Nitrospirota bacterium]